MDRIVAVALLISLACTSAAFARSSPPGACSLLDDGVATTAPGAGAQPDDPHVLAMSLPSGRFGAGVIDLHFAIKSDGFTASPQILCSKPNANALEREILASVAAWRFTPMKRHGKPVASEADYRIIVDDLPAMIRAVPLAFAPKLSA